MKTVSICSAFYESGRPYLDDCMTSILAAAAITSDCQVRMIIAIDDLQNPEETLSKYADDIAVTLVPTPDGASITGVRNAVFEHARLDTSDFLIFLDMDDLMAEDGIRLHLESLSQADISYGDMWIVDSEGRPLKGSLYADIDIPACVDAVAPLLQRNFLGLSNTAIRRTALDRLPSRVPEHLVATDWWFYTVLIHEGCRAVQTSGPIGSYRQHSANILGSNPATDKQNLKKRCKIMRDHYAALPDIDGLTALNQRVIGVEDAIERDTDVLARILEETCKTPGAWFEEIFRIADRLDLEA